jgi:hypothetical protein
MLHDAAHAPPSEQLPRLVAHVKKYHYPDLSEAKIAEVLSRGGNRYWRVGDHSECEQEYLLGWMIDILMHWETRDFDVAKDRQDAARLAGNGEVEATLSWIEAADRLAREHKVPLQVSWRRSARWTRNMPNSGSRGRALMVGAISATSGRPAWSEHSERRTSASSISETTSMAFPTPIASLTVIGVGRARRWWQTGSKKELGALLRR